MLVFLLFFCRRVHPISCNTFSSLSPFACECVLFDFDVLIVIFSYSIFIRILFHQQVQYFFHLFQLRLCCWHFSNERNLFLTHKVNKQSELLETFLFSLSFHCLSTLGYVDIESLYSKCLLFLYFSIPHSLHSKKEIV